MTPNDVTFNGDVIPVQENGDGETGVLLSETKEKRNTRAGQSWDAMIVALENGANFATAALAGNYEKNFLHNLKYKKDPRFPEVEAAVQRFRDSLIPLALARLAKNLEAQKTIVLSEGMTDTVEDCQASNQAAALLLKAGMHGGFGRQTFDHNVMARPMPGDPLELVDPA